MKRNTHLLPLVRWMGSVAPPVFVFLSAILCSVLIVTHCPRKNTLFNSENKNKKKPGFFHCDTNKHSLFPSYFVCFSSSFSSPLHSIAKLISPLPKTPLHLILLLVSLTSLFPCFTLQIPILSNPTLTSIPFASWFPLLQPLETHPSFPLDTVIPLNPAQPAIIIARRLTSTHSNICYDFLLLIKYLVPNRLHPPNQKTKTPTIVK